MSTVAATVNQYFTQVEQRINAAEATNRGLQLRIQALENGKKNQAMRIIVLEGLVDKLQGESKKKAETVKAEKTIPFPSHEPRKPSPEADESPEANDLVWKIFGTPVTPPSSRAKIVEIAKADVKTLSTTPRSNVRNLKGQLENFHPNGPEAKHYPIDEVIFTRQTGSGNYLSNEITAEIRYLAPLQPLAWARGTAKCDPGDVFNVHIGKAIALRRALGLPVPNEYFKLPAPGDDGLIKAGTVLLLESGEYTLLTPWRSDVLLKHDGFVRILDDSNAKGAYEQ